MATVVELVVFAVVGLFGVNAVPHFVRGVTGQRHMTPFGSESSAVLNVLWVYRDAVAASTLAVAFVVGVAMAVGLASYWSVESPKVPWE